MYRGRSRCMDGCPISCRIPYTSSTRSVKNGRSRYSTPSGGSHECTTRHSYNDGTRTPLSRCVCIAGPSRKVGSVGDGTLIRLGLLSFAVTLLSTPIYIVEDRDG
ncbi:hypothetical protein BD310DRAFT_927694 [Dichomitus squalens]|uniref:Uncharacterized protein n=1 Tax=Dichomitus squalens TaxID=114155 RepID=A0A4Q9PUS5_9APHY|nr:hypothetical protein BD310DRAFT_927694 [Dichomitus squalens]